MSEIYKRDTMNEMTTLVLGCKVLECWSLSSVQEIRLYVLRNIFVFLISPFPHPQFIDEL